MKRVVTFDKANQPYGFAQLDNVGNIPGNVTASYAATAGVANNAITANNAATADLATVAISALNGTQWATTVDGIAYGDGNVTIGLASQPGVHVSKYQPIVGNADDSASMTALFANSTYDSSFISPNIYNVSLNQDSYALLFEGSITVPTNGTYRFGLGSDDASDAYINGTKIADYYGSHGGDPNYAGGNQYPITLTAGKHALTVRFVEFSGNDFVSLLWSQDNGSTWAPVPDSWFTYETTSLSQLKLNNGAIITGSIILSSGSIEVTGSVNITGSLTQNGYEVKPYKVYTALLTQTGGNEAGESLSGTLYKGVTYFVNPSGGSSTVTDYDFSNVGGPIYPETFTFVATKTEIPTSWGVQSNPEDPQYIIGFNFGAPLVNVLENTIGNIWWTYTNVGIYNANSSGLFTADKTYVDCKTVFGGQWDKNIFENYEESDFPNYVTIKNYSILSSATEDNMDVARIEIRVYN